MCRVMWFFPQRKTVIYHKLNEVQRFKVGRCLTTTPPQNDDMHHSSHIIYLRRGGGLQELHSSGYQMKQRNHLWIIRMNTKSLQSLHVACCDHAMLQNLDNSQSSNFIGLCFPDGSRQFRLNDRKFAPQRHILGLDSIDKAEIFKQCLVLYDIEQYTIFRLILRPSRMNHNAV